LIFFFTLIEINKRFKIRSRENQNDEFFKIFMWALNKELRSSI